MNAAIFGGSFNPIHFGHLALSQSVIDMGYERIIFVLAKDPPHKVLASGATDVDRLKMLRSAVADIPQAMVWDGELRRDGPSFSIDSVDELKNLQFFEGKPGFIIGDDLVHGFATWRDVDRLAVSTDILLARRHGVSNDAFPFPHRVLKNSIWPFSSTQIRHMILKGLPFLDFVPVSVAHYIKDNGLYGIQ